MMQEDALHSKAKIWLFFCMICYKREMLIKSSKKCQLLEEGSPKSEMNWRQTTSVLRWVASPTVSKPASARMMVILRLTVFFISNNIYVMLKMVYFTSVRFRQMIYFVAIILVILYYAVSWIRSLNFRAFELKSPLFFPFTPPKFRIPRSSSAIKLSRSSSSWRLLDKSCWKHTLPNSLRMISFISLYLFNSFLIFKTCLASRWMFFLNSRSLSSSALMTSFLASAFRNSIVCSLTVSCASSALRDSELFSSRRISISFWNPYC